jgi:hypothetical protein
VPFSIAQHEKSSRTLRAGCAGGRRANARIRVTAILDHFSLMRASELGRDEETALSTEQRNVAFPLVVMAGLDPAGPPRPSTPFPLDVSS